MIQIKVNGEWVEGLPTEGQEARESAGGKLVNGKLNLNTCGWHTYIAPIIKGISDLKSDLIDTINPEAEQRIKSLDWKKERAEEQPLKYSLDDVLAERQAIRDASNQAKIDIEALTAIEDVKSFTW